MPLPNQKNNIPTLEDINQEITENFEDMEDYSNEPDLDSLQELTDEDLDNSEYKESEYQEEYQGNIQENQDINDKADYKTESEPKQESDYEKQLKAAQEKEKTLPKKKKDNKKLMIISAISLTVFMIIIIVLGIFIFNKNKNNPKVETEVSKAIETETNKAEKTEQKVKKEKKKNNVFSNQDFEITFYYPYIDITPLQKRSDGSLYLIIKNENDYSICYTASNTFTKGNVKTEEISCNGTQPNKKSKIENIYLINE